MAERPFVEAVMNSRSHSPNSDRLGPIVVARCSRSLRLVFAIAASLASPVLLAAPADLDTSFNGGVFAVSAGGTATYGSTMMLQPDGRSLVGGHVDNGSDHRWLLVRRNTNGLADPTFGGGQGQVVTSVGDLVSGSGYDGSISDLAVQPNGKIVAVGSGYDAASSSSRFHLVRWLPDGSVDATFGKGGDALITVPGLPAAELSKVALQEDGKIVVAGDFFDNDSGAFAPMVVRYTTSGSLDTSFGSGGVFRLPAWTKATQQGFMGGLAIRPDGRILLSINQPDRYPDYIEVIHLTIDGALDTSFSSVGISQVGMGNLNDGRSIGVFSVQPSSGKMTGFAVWRSGSEFPGKLAVYRLVSDGSFDTSFIGDGYRSLSAQVVEQLLTGQTLYSYGGGGITTGRLAANGHPDTTFFNSAYCCGASTAVPSGSTPTMSSIIKVQDDGRFIIMGNNGKILMIRYEGDPTVVTPKAFTFTKVTGVPVSTVEVSNVITISGLTFRAPVPIRVVGGSYSVNGYPFTTQLGYVGNGDQVMVEHTSAATSNTLVTTRLRVGGMNDARSLWAIRGTQTIATFTSTTK